MVSSCLKFTRTGKQSYTAFGFKGEWKCFGLIEVLSQLLRQNISFPNHVQNDKMCVGNTQHLQALSCFMKNAMLMIRLLASLCFSAISKGEREERGGFLQLFFLVVLEERGLLLSNGFERLWFPVSPLLTSAPHLFINLFHWTLQGICSQKPLSWGPIIVWSGRGLVSLQSGNWGKAMDLL